jgi:CRP/FNR family transcriptional regulator
MIRQALASYDFEEPLIQEIEAVGHLKKISHGNSILEPGLPKNEIPFVLEGLLKVYRKDPNGREVLLYYLEPGETCAMSISCCLEKKRSSIKVVAEEDAQLWMIPNSNLDRWMSKFPSFKRFVFSSYQSRFDELMETIDSFVFDNMEERLMKYLLDTKQATASYEVKKTHQQIANELNTSRVVISRLLKKFEQEEKIIQYRNRIEIL